MIKTSTRSAKTPMANKSRLPVPHKSSKKSSPTPGSCHKARPAPNFSRLHQNWQDRFETGKICGKKPCTVPQEFEVTRPGTRFTHDGADSDGESLPDFEADQFALESILNDRGVGQNRVTGRATLAIEKPSTGKMKRSRSAHSIGKRRVFGELACDPDQKRNGRRRSRSAKKALEFSKELQKSAESDFQRDEQAMESILNETGISVTGNTDQGRFTYAGPAPTTGITQTRQSLYYVPQTDRMSMAKAMTAYQNLLLSKLDSKGAKLHTPSDESMNQVLDRYNYSQQVPKVVQSPFGRTMATPIRNSIYKSYQIQSNLRSPHPNGHPTDKEEMSDVNARTPKRVLPREAQGSSRRAPYSCKSSSKKNVKWADVLNDETSCDVPVAFKTEKVSRKSLFQPLSANDTFVDDYKENSVPGDGEARPGGRGHSDRRDHANGDDATTALQHYSGTAAGDESSQTAATESSPSSVAELAVLSMTHPASLRTGQASTAPRTRHPTQDTGHGHTSAHLAPPPPSHALLDVTPGITPNQHFYQTATHGSQDVKGLAKVPCAVPCGPVNPHSGTTAWTGYGDSAANTNRQRLQAIGEQEVLLECKIGQVDMAMHTDETEDGQTPQQGETTATDHVARATDTQDRVTRFVGHVKRSRKRQSIAELNESITESHVHLQRLEGEISRLQHDGQGESELQQDSNQGNTQTETTNIIYHLEMIRKQQEQLVFLEQQLQEQLTYQAQSHLQGQGHCVTQGQNRTNLECDSVNGNNAFKESVARSQGHLTGQGQSTVFCDTMVYSENNNVIVNPADIPVTVTSQYTQRDCDTTKQPSSERMLVPNMGPWTSPMWTPRGLQVAAQGHRAPLSQTITDFGTTPTVRECGAELPCPIDLSRRSPMAGRSAGCDSPKPGGTLDNTSTCQSPHRTAFSPTAPSIGNTNSAFASVGGSSLGLGSPFRSLSLKASVMSSPARSSPLRMMRRDEESLLRVVSVRTNERYLEALLDEECALYAYRLQTLRTEEENRMDITNPVARVLSEGDDMHFVPIMEDSPHAISLRENSAFCCYAR